MILCNSRVHIQFLAMYTLSGELVGDVRGICCETRLPDNRYPDG